MIKACTQNNTYNMSKTSKAPKASRKVEIINTSKNIENEVNVENETKTEKNDSSNSYIITQNELFTIFKKSVFNISDEEFKDVAIQLSKYSIGSTFSVSIRQRKSGNTTTKTRKTRKPRPAPMVIENPDGKSVKGLTYTGAIQYIIKAHGPLTSSQVYQYAMAYGWECTKGGKTPSNTFGAILGTESSNGRLIRVKGDEGTYVYDLPAPCSPKKVSKVSKTRKPVKKKKRKSVSPSVSSLDDMANSYEVILN
jgi:hypothetical protein